MGDINYNPDNRQDSIYTQEVGKRWKAVKIKIAYKTSMGLSCEINSQLKSLIWRLATDSAAWLQH